MALDIHGSIQQLTESLTALQALSGLIEEAAIRLTARLRAGGTVMFFGNGGSAAIAEHLAAELVGRFHHDRRPWPALALSDGVVLSAIANDYHFTETFARQVQAHCRLDDAVVGLSTSGTSLNVLEGLHVARDIGALTVALTGQGPNAASRVAHVAICVPSTYTARVQECHLFIGHLWCEAIEQQLTQLPPPRPDGLRGRS